ncbi:MAG: hypothetical protein J0L92_18900, partial [Deltaproteobacteria bacterium]|nr:hypothetical protein [Deltaproteobacteria bacterium]
MRRELAARRARTRWLIVGCVIAGSALVSVGCESGPARTPAQPPPRERVVEEWHEEPVEETGDTPDPEGEEPLEALALAPAVEPVEPEHAIALAAARDLAYDNDEPIAVRRYVYRV